MSWFWWEVSAELREDGWLNRDDCIFKWVHHEWDETVGNSWRCEENHWSIFSSKVQELLLQKTQRYPRRAAGPRAGWTKHPEVAGEPELHNTFSSGEFTQPLIPTLQLNTSCKLISLPFFPQNDQMCRMERIKSSSVPIKTYIIFLRHFLK